MLNLIHITSFKMKIHQTFLTKFRNLVKEICCHTLVLLPPNSMSKQYIDVIFQDQPTPAKNGQIFNGGFS